MNLVDVILLGIALGIDCLISSFAQGIVFEHKRLKNSLILALTMGLFQGFMPCIGYFGTGYIYNVLEPVSKLLVFGIFLLLGLKFIFDSFQPEEKPVCSIDIKCLLGLGVATSIDALVSGAGLNLTHTSIIFSAIIIGITSFLMSLIGFWGGNLFRIFSARSLEITGGLILIFLAFKAML